MVGNLLLAEKDLSESDNSGDLNLKFNIGIIEMEKTEYNSAIKKFFQGNKEK